MRYAILLLQFLALSLYLLLNLLAFACSPFFHLLFCILSKVRNYLLTASNMLYIIVYVRCYLGGLIMEFVNMLCNVVFAVSILFMVIFFCRWLRKK